MGNRNKGCPEPRVDPYVFLDLGAVLKNCLEGRLTQVGVRQNIEVRFADFYGKRRQLTG